MRHALPCLLTLASALALALAACDTAGDASSQSARGSQLDVDQVKASAFLVGGLVRAAAVCGVPVSTTAKDRAARIEAAALDIAMREGGQPARDSYLQSVQPPNFETRRQGQDRTQYCDPKRPEMERVNGFLFGAEGAALAQRADIIHATKP